MRGRVLPVFIVDPLPGADICVTLTTQPQPADLTVGDAERREPASESRDGLLPELRRLLTESAGTIGYVAYLLETRAAEVDDWAQAQLYDDVSVVAEELVTVKELLGSSVDWDAEAGRLFGGEVPPLEPDDDSEEDTPFE
ncbi:MAG: hypothetical protein ACTHQQ_15025 [Solirubrobacteraceae bacterium]